MPKTGLARAGSAKFTIGRDRDCDVPIADDSVSRVHAELTLLEGGKLLLADHGSSNGTCVLQHGKPRRIEQSYVEATDQVQFGAVVLHVSDILDAIRGKIARQNDGKIPHALADRLIRCECGAVKQSGRHCPECGQ